MPIHPDQLLQLSKIIEKHLVNGTLPNGTIRCTCGQRHASVHMHASHMAEVVETALVEVVQSERTRAQIELLAAVSRFWGPSRDGTSARSRAVYTGAQFAGWCRERAQALSRSIPGPRKPPTPTEGPIP